MMEQPMSPNKRILLWLMGGFYVLGGLGHFLFPKPYLQIMPGYLPWHRPLVYLSGAAESALGIAVLIPNLRRLAAWGIIALLIAVFPANLYMATAKITHFEGLPAWVPEFTVAGLWARLPLQALFIAWAWWYTRPGNRPADGPAPAAGTS